MPRCRPCRLFRRMWQTGFRRPESGRSHIHCGTRQFPRTTRPSLSPGCLCPMLVKRLSPVGSRPAVSSSQVCSSVLRPKPRMCLRPCLSSRASGRPHCTAGFRHSRKAGRHRPVSWWQDGRHGCGLSIHTLFSQPVPVGLSPTGIGRERPWSCQF